MERAYALQGQDCNAVIGGVWAKLGLETGRIVRRNKVLFRLYNVIVVEQSSYRCTDIVITNRYSY